MMLLVLPQRQPISTEPVAVLQMLQEQQVAYTVQLSDAKRQYNEAAKEYEHAAGAQKEAARARLTEAESRMAITQQRLTSVTEHILEVKQDIAIGSHAPPAFMGVPAPEGQLFGVPTVALGGGLALLFVFPIVLGLTQWMWRRTSNPKTPANALDGSPQLARLERAVEAIAIEVERISEAQRFSAKLLSERTVEAQAEQAARSPRARRPVVTPLP